MAKGMIPAGSPNAATAKKIRGLHPQGDMKRASGAAGYTKGGAATSLKGASMNKPVKTSATRVDKKGTVC
jgi:hypothetical protein